MYLSKNMKKTFSQGIPEWHSKKCTLQKPLKNTHKDMNEPEFVLEIQLVSMSQLTADKRQYNAAAGLWFPR